MVPSESRVQLSLSSDGGGCASTKLILPPTPVSESQFLKQPPGHAILTPTVNALQARPDTFWHGFTSILNIYNPELCYTIVRTVNGPTYSFKPCSCVCVRGGGKWQVIVTKIINNKSSQLCTSAFSFFLAKHAMLLKSSRCLLDEFAYITNKQKIQWIPL